MVDGAMRYVRRKHPIDEVEDVQKVQNVRGKSATCLLTRAASCDLALVPGRIHGKERKITLKRYLSAPNSDKYSIHFDFFTASATVHHLDSY